MKLYYHTTPYPGNMGDILNKWLVERLSHDKVILSKPGDDVYMCIGSIIKFACPGMNIWGTGTMRMTDTLSPYAKYHAVRGPLTRELILTSGGECPEIYGDPALLMPYLYNPPVSKKYQIGIVPHYVDYDAVTREFPQYRVINILNANPLAVIDEIMACEEIVTSSLHGMILAQAYGIPSALVQPIKGKLSGDGTKFLDYLMSTGQNPALPVPMENIEAIPKTADIEFDAQKLMDACPFPSLKTVKLAKKQTVKTKFSMQEGINPSPVVVSFFTHDYAGHANRLRDECSAIGLEHHIVYHQPIGEWIDNTRIKGRIVLDAIKKHNKPVLWVDADSSIHRHPDLFTCLDADFAAKLKHSPDRPFAVGHLWFNNTPKGREFLQLWAEECDNAPQGVSDEWAIARAWERIEGVRVANLPEEYFAHKVRPGTVLSVRISGNATKHLSKG
jgi:hypothetical protein